MPNWFIALPVKGDEWWSNPPPAPARVRVFAPADLHVTVAFLGDVGETRALQAFEGVSAWPPLRIHFALGEVLALGSPRRPSALSAWVDEGRLDLARAIGDCRGGMFEAAGARPDRRTPLPHVTVARIQRRASNAERRLAFAWAAELDLTGPDHVADRIALYTGSTERSRRLFDIVESRTLGESPD